MALGISGSNGGISKEKAKGVDLIERPLEVSYFINNSCNLKCVHCYVGYEEKQNDLSIDEWIETFDELIGMGALTFGNVGKEPLLEVDKTLALLDYFARKRQENSNLRFGLVTNGTLLTEEIIKELERIMPDYVDVSVDGIKETHERIRGKNTFDKTYNNLRSLPKSLAEKVFISYTLMNTNKDVFPELINEFENTNINKFLISPYVSSPQENTGLEIKNEEVVQFYKTIINGDKIDFSKHKTLEILLKSDYDAQKPLIEALVKNKIIDVNNLLVDKYGVLFNEYKKENGSRIFVNFMPFSDTLSRAIRISHDGYVSGCLEMFHKDYKQRTIGNVKIEKIRNLINY